MSIAPAEHLKPELRRGASRYSLLPADFFARLNWCQRAVSTNGPIKPQGPLYQGMLQDPHCGVLLAEVAAFLTQAEYEVPAEMRAWPERGPVALEVGDAPGAQRYKRRADQLSAVLSLAKKRAVAPDDWMSVWASLVKLAQAPDRPAPLLGYSEGEGVKYQTDSDAEPVGWLRREAVRKRLTR